MEFPALHNVDHGERHIPRRRDASNYYYSSNHVKIAHLDSQMIWDKLVEG